jgi:hypothetical protein
MALVTKTLTATGTQVLSRVHIPRAKSYLGGVLLVSGTFGGGTVTLEISNDGGVTSYPLKDVHGVAISATAAGQFNFRIFGDGNSNFDSENLDICVKLTGATNPNITVKMFDNR